MELRDLPPRRDPKGGSPKTPAMGIPISQYEAETLPNGHAAIVWRTIAMIEMAIISTAAVAFLALGIDNVKHSEIDAIMATRAPYIHDRQRLQENFDALKNKQNEFEARIHYLEMRHEDGKP